MSVLIPRFRLIDLCGPGYVFNSRVPDNAARWIFATPASADAATGNQLTVLGDMPLLCSAGVATPAGLGLLRDIGFELEAEPVTFRDAAERLDKMRRLAAQGRVFIDQHVQPDTSLHPGGSWVDPRLLSSLNNKSRLSDWVPARHLPAREVRRRDALAGLAADPARFPLVLKAVTEASCGSGKGVRIVRDAAELKAAQGCFAGCDSLIVEEFLPMERNLCVNYAVFADGRIEYLGAAQQIIDDRHHYRGNWLEPPGTVPRALIQTGHDLMLKAYRHGYRGFAGFDCAVGGNGSFYIYDLNFRFNGSTAPLLLYDALARHTGLPVAKYSAWKYSGDYEDMLRALRAAFDKHRLIPINTFDPSRCAGIPACEPRVTALLFGASQEDVQEKECRLGVTGFFQ